MVCEVCIITSDKTQAKKDQVASHGHINSESLWGVVEWQSCIHSPKLFFVGEEMV